MVGAGNDGDVSGGWGACVSDDAEDNVAFGARNRALKNLPLDVFRNPRFMASLSYAWFSNCDVIDSGR